MTQKEFSKISFFSILGSTGLQSLFALIFPAVLNHFRFSLFCLIFFLSVLILSYYVGRVLAKSSLKTAFTGFAMGIILLKLMASIGIVIGYQQSMQPEDLYYVLIFALYYVAFTVGEVTILMQLSKSTA